LVDRKWAVYTYASLFRLILNNGVRQLKDSNGDLVDTLGQNVCPYGYTNDKISNRFQPIEVGERGKYGGMSFTSRTQQLNIDATDGIIPDPEPASSSGVCQSDDECSLPFGPSSTCSASTCINKDSDTGLYN